MVPKLSSFLAELVFELVEAGKEESAQEIRSLSVRIKTYDSSDPDGQQLLCHFKVSSSCPLPVEELLREQKLSELAQFLLHVQQQADEDCHCVLMRTVPDRTEPDSGGRFLASSVSLTVRRELGPRAAEQCPCGQDRAHGSQTEEGPWERGDRCGGGGPNSDGGEGTGCSSSSRGKIAVASVRLGESPSGAEAEKEGAHLHVRFLAEKMHILEEGKIIHDFLHQLKLFHPTMKLSFVLSIDALVTRASYR